jgi:acetylglutamate kinase
MKSNGVGPLGYAAPVIVKLGGRALEGEGQLSAFIRELAAVRAPLVLVHGGGAEVSAWLERAGHPTRFLDGLRVTDEPTLEIVTAVLAGLANKRLVAALRHANLDAVGIAALDGGILETVPHRDAARLGHVGEVAAVTPALLEMLLAQGRIPVVASIGAHQGALLNLNADDVAAALAPALRARMLVLVSDTPGLRIQGEIMGRLGLGEALALLDHPDVEGGMRPKLAAATRAVAGGAGAAVIARWEGPGTLAALLGGEGSGTYVSAQAAAEGAEARHD